MWLHLDLDGILFNFRIAKYRKSIPEIWDEQWCKTDLTLQNYNWLNYQTSSEMLLSCEVEKTRDKISDLLEDKIQTVEEISFIEPDLSFILRPKKDIRKDPDHVYVAPGYEILDIDSDMRVYFWNDGLTANYLSLCYNRNDLENLLTDMQLVTNEIPTDDKTVQKLITKDIIRIC